MGGPESSDERRNRRTCRSPSRGHGRCCGDGHGDLFELLRDSAFGAADSLSSRLRYSLLDVGGHGVLPELTCGDVGGGDVAVLSRRRHVALDLLRRWLHA